MKKIERKLLRVRFCWLQAQQRHDTYCVFRDSTIACKLLSFLLEEQNSRIARIKQESFDPVADTLHR